MVAETHGESSPSSPVTGTPWPRAASTAHASPWQLDEFFWALEPDSQQLLAACVARTERTAANPHSPFCRVRYNRAVQVPELEGQLTSRTFFMMHSERGSDSFESTANQVRRVAVARCAVVALLLTASCASMYSKWPVRDVLLTATAIVHDVFQVARLGCVALLSLRCCSCASMYLKWPVWDVLLCCRCAADGDCSCASMYSKWPVWDVLLCCRCAADGDCSCVSMYSPPKWPIALRWWRTSRCRQA